MAVVEGASGTRRAETGLGGRFRLDERISVKEHISGTSSRAADGLCLWKATDQLLDRPVIIYLLPAGREVPGDLVEAARAAAQVSDPRLATIYDTDFSAGCPFIVSEWTPGTPLENLVRSGLPAPALAAAMIADAADAIAVAHQAGVPHLRLTPRSLRWDNSSGLKITGLGLGAALADPALADPALPDPVLARSGRYRAAARARIQGAGVHAAAGPGRSAGHPRRHHLSGPARTGSGRPGPAADAGRARDGAARGPATVHPARRRA